MKSFKSVFAKTAGMLVLVSSLNSFSSNTQAQLTPQYVSVNEFTGNIRFVRVVGDMLVFELHLNTILPKGSTLRVSDGENNLIFEERTSTATYNIRYKIFRNDMDKVNFEISDKKLLLNQSFNIKSRMEEKAEVTKA